MEERQKVYIKGVPGRGDEVIRTLENLGGILKYNLNGGIPECIYFIHHDGTISSVFFYSESELGQIIMDHYREIKLPEKWKDGDILIDKDTDNRFCVFKEYLEENNTEQNKIFSTYYKVLQGKEKDYLLSNSVLYVSDYRLAGEQEITRFREFLHKFHKDWDEKTKQLIDWRWRPKKNEVYYFIDINGKIRKDLFQGKTDIDLYNFGNCFQSSEEAKEVSDYIGRGLRNKTLNPYKGV